MDGEVLPQNPISTTRKVCLSAERCLSERSAEAGWQHRQSLMEADADALMGGSRSAEGVAVSSPSTLSPTAVGIGEDPLDNAEQGCVRFRGLAPGKVLALLVSMGGGNPLFAVWGKDLVRLWATELTAGERVAFEGTEGVADFLHGITDGTCGTRSDGCGTQALSAATDAA